MRQTVPNIDIVVWPVGPRHTGSKECADHWQWHYGDDVQVLSAREYSVFSSPRRRTFCFTRRRRCQTD